MKKKKLEELKKMKASAAIAIVINAIEEILDDLAKHKAWLMEEVEP